MKNCERSQVELSALLDGEVDAAQLADALDHALGCDDCRHGYAAFRALQRQLPAAPSIRRRRVPMTLLRSAALAACVLLSLSWAWRQAPVQAPERSFEIELGAHPERMDDARFVAMAVELLQADPRYAHSMRLLLRQVGEGPLSPEIGLGESVEAETASLSRRYH